jgi:hypothetical protein
MFDPFEAYRSEQQRHRSNTFQGSAGRSIILAFPIILGWRGPRCQPCVTAHADRYAANAREVRLCAIARHRSTASNNIIGQPTIADSYAARHSIAGFQWTPRFLSAS